MPTVLALCRDRLHAPTGRYDLALRSYVPRCAALRTSSAPSCPPIQRQPA